MNEAMRDWVANVADTYYLIGTVAGPHPYPTMVRDFQSRDRRGGQAAAAGSRGPPARRRGRLHRRRLQRHGPVPSVPRRSDGAADRRRGRRATGSTRGEHAASLTGGRPGVLHGNRTYLLQDDDGQIIEAHSISAGLDYPGIGPGAFLAARHRPRRIRRRHRRRGAGGVPALHADRGHHPGAGARACAGARAEAGADDEQGRRSS